MRSPLYRSRWPRRKTFFIAAVLTATSILLLSRYHFHSMSLRDTVTVTSTDYSYSSHDDHYSLALKFSIPTHTHSSSLQSCATLTATPSPSPILSSSPPPDLPLGLYELIKPHLHSITAKNFTSRTGKVYQLPKNPRFTQPLEKNILILDVESRDIGGPGGLLDEDNPNTDALQGLTFGRLNHYMFAMLHGYDYQLVQLPNDPTLHGTWNKVPAMREAIKHYEYVVFMDGDAIFTHPHLPLEWLLNYWGISNHTTMALAEDPDAPLFYNLKNIDRNLNTGFVIAHQTPKSEEFFEAWMTCPDETRYEGCAVWKLQLTHEQAVVNEYLRYDYPEEIQILPCTEANRYPGSGDCEGEFVSHYWPFKEMIPSGGKEVMAQYFWPPLQKAYSHDRDNLVVAMKRHDAQEESLNANEPVFEEEVLDTNEPGMKEDAVDVNEPDTEENKTS